MTLAEEIVDLYTSLWTPMHFEGDMQKMLQMRKDLRFSNDPVKYCINLGGKAIQIFGLNTPAHKHNSAVLFELPDKSLLAVTQKRDYVQTFNSIEEITDGTD